MTRHVGSARWHRGSRIAVVVLASLLLTVLTVFAATADEAPGDATAGRERFQSTCATCHGPDAGGQGTTPAIRDAVARLGVDEVRATIVDGRGGMPSFGSTLDDEEIDDVVAYLSELSSEDGDEPDDDDAGGDDASAGDGQPGGADGHGPMGGMPGGVGPWVIIAAVLLVAIVVGVVFAAVRSGGPRDDTHG
ncbi:MAG: c-type cytochrome [Nitriliruptoraceae bacterium]